ncbi:MAG: hypothetical protein M3436_02265 [Pseudomonadota bacterium]|nr:hypothetical protein [Pseudomonadota bacterium]
MAYKRITIHLKGDPSDDDHLRLSDFTSQLDAIRGALNRLEETITDDDKRAIYYRVIDLRHSSPAAVVLDAIPTDDSKDDITALVVDKFVGGIKLIQQGISPPGFTYDLFESFKKIAGPLRKRVSELSISTDSETIEVTKEIETYIDKIVGPDELTRGSISGTLEYFNVHAGANLFRIYPIVGPKKVECHFPNELLSKAIAGVTKYVNVEGELRYKSREPFAYAINVIDIEIFPDDQQLPSILDLRGIAPSATGNLTSEEFVGLIRNAQW